MFSAHVFSQQIGHLTLPRKKLSHLRRITPARRVHVNSDSGEEHELDAKEPPVKSDREA